MIEYKPVVVSKPAACICDRCGRRIEDGDSEWVERLSVDFVAGYDSVFGDGNRVQLGLCQQCVRDALGAWLHVSPPEQ
jgi:hypothetical protein